MSVRVFVPGDTAAVAVGADDVASSLAKAAQQAGRDIEIIRNGSRGAFHLETLVEVETDAGRIGYGPVDTSDVDGLVASGLFDGGAHPLRLGEVGALPFFRRQTRLTFKRAGITDPLSLSDYAAHGGVGGGAEAVPGTGHRDRQGVRPSRPWRRWLSGGGEVGDGARGAR